MADRGHSFCALNPRAVLLVQQFGCRGSSKHSSERFINSRLLLGSPRGGFHVNNELRARLRRNRVARLTAVVNIKFHRFAGIVEHLGPRVYLTDATGRRRSADDVSAVLLLLQSNCVSQSILLRRLAGPISAPSILPCDAAGGHAATGNSSLPQRGYALQAYSA